MFSPYQFCSSSKKFWFACALTSFFIYAESNLLLADDKDTGILKIGAIFPLSGSQQAYGQEALAGIELALTQIKQTNPELAKKIVLIKADDKSIPSESEKAARHLLAVERVSIFFGSISNSSTAAIAKIAQQSKKPLVIPASTTPGITNISPYIFRSCTTNPYQGKILAAFAQNQLNAKRAALLINKDLPYAVKIANNFEAFFIGRGGVITSKEYYRLGTKSYKPKLKSITATKPDIILAPSYYPEAATIMKQMRQMGIRTPLLGGDGWDNPNLNKIAGAKASTGHYYSVLFSSKSTTQNTIDFVERFKKKMNRYPSSLAAMTYDGILVIAEAFRKAGTTRAKPLSKALSRIKGLEGVVGKISINKDRNAEKPGIILKTTATGSVFETRVNPYLDVAHSIKNSKENVKNQDAG
jgi:branched-chain amino acid transport system substrate-binding protein